MSAFSIEEGNTTTFGVKIKVIGVGGGGGNAIDHIVREGINKLPGMERVDLLAANTDTQVLVKSLATSTIQLGEKKTKGVVTTAIVRASISLAARATIGAAPVPVPPPKPAAIKTIFALSSMALICS